VKTRRILIAALALVMLLVMTAPSLAPALAVPESTRSIRDNQIGGERSRLFSAGWKFQINSGNFYAYDYDDTTWQDVDVPHDWLVRDVNNLYRADVGWYRKTFYLPESDRGKNIAIRFDGVMRDTTVYVNGEQAGQYPCGWSTFQMDITDKLNFGNTPNVVAVRVNYRYQDAWWYTGAGMLRDVWLTVADPVHVNFNGTYISTKDITASSAVAVIETEVMNKSGAAATVTVAQTVIDADGTAVAAGESAVLAVPAGQVAIDTRELTVPNPKLWGIDAPNLYTMKTEIKSGGAVIDTYTTTFGFRTIRLDPNNGLFLNGEYVKVHGVCLHDDMGALGAISNYAAMERRLIKMKEMGVNAIRTAHNVCPPEWVELCDKLGLLMDNEGFVRWTTVSYFNTASTADRRYLPKLSASPTWAEVEARNWVRRDRNHPSVFLWSIGNEVPDQTSQAGYNTGIMLRNLVRSEDPNGNAATTVASNSMSNSWSQNLGRDLDAAGYNYGESMYSSHHTSWPNMVIYGSETASAVSSRGIYHTPANESVYTHPDNQVSSYGNSVVPWGRSAESSWIMDRDRVFCFGQFVWTGYDYIGEPTPYSTKNSYFGIVDTAGLPKDSYWFYQSVWGDKPMVHLLPYWDSSMGESIAVWAYSNAASVELFKDGVSLGRKAINLRTASVLHYEWIVPYSDGELIARGYDAATGGNVIATDRIATFGDSAKVSLEADCTDVTADGLDLFYVTASILDAGGEFVATARNRVEFTVAGPGKLVGVDNGDSTDYDPYQSTERAAFSGKVVAIVQSTGADGPITVSATSIGLASGSVTVNAVHNQAVTGMTLASIDGTNAITAPRGKLKMQETIAPKTADYEKVAYTVTEVGGGATDKAVIDKNGVLTAFKDGQVLVTARAADGTGISASAIVAISGQTAIVPVTGITLSGTANITAKAGTRQLTASVAPSNPTVRNVGWTVYNKDGAGASRATVSCNGLVQALYNGVVTVRATALDGSGAYGEMDVTISGQSATAVPATKIIIEIVEGTQELTASADTVKVRADLRPLGSVAAVNWSITSANGSQSTNARVVGVDANGVATVTASRSGVFYITASTNNGGRYPQVFASLRFNATGIYAPIETINPYNEIKARTYKSSSGGLGLEGPSSNQSVGSINSGSWLGFESLDFGPWGSATVKITGGRGMSGNATIRIRDGSQTGTILATVNFAQVHASDWLVLGTQEFTLAGITGIHDIYFESTNGGFLFNSFQFTEKAAGATRDPYSTVKAKTYDAGSKTYALETDEEALGGISGGNYVQFNYLDFGNLGTRSVTIRGGSHPDYAPTPIEIRDGSPTGQLIATLSFESTGGWHDFLARSFTIPLITGIRNICFVFPNGAFAFESFSFKPYIRSAFKTIEAEGFDEAVGSGKFEIAAQDDAGKAATTVACTDNDSLLFERIDFGTTGAATIKLYGRLINGTGKNIRAKIRDGEELFSAILEAKPGFALYEFDVPATPGLKDVEFIFLPGGGEFLFDWFVFTEAEPVETNIFLNKLARALTENVSDNNQIASNAVDGDTSNTKPHKWCAGNGNYPQWIQVDLGSLYDIIDMDLVLENTTSLFRYTIAVSDDPADWDRATWDASKTVVDLSTNASNRERHFAINATGRYVRITHTAAVDGLWAVVSNISGKGRSHNIAQGKPASASTEWDGQMASMANNNIINNQALGWKNQWCANNGAGGPHWWQVDLKDAYALSGIELTMEGAYNYGFALQGSMDGENYATIANITGGGRVISVKTDAYARYLRVYDISAGSGMWPCIQNFVAYGSRVDSLPSFNLSVAETASGANARLSYLAETSLTAKLYAAAYDKKGKMLQVACKDITIEGSGAEDLPIDFSKGNVAQVNAFLFDEDYVPLIEKAQINF